MRKYADISVNLDLNNKAKKSNRIRLSLVHSIGERESREMRLLCMTNNFHIIEILLHIKGSKIMNSNLIVVEKQKRHKVIDPW